MFFMNIIKSAFKNPWTYIFTAIAIGLIALKTNAFKPREQILITPDSSMPDDRKIVQ